MLFSFLNSRGNRPGIQKKVLFDVKLFKQKIQNGFIIRDSIKNLVVRSFFGPDAELKADQFLETNPVIDSSNVFRIDADELKTYDLRYDEKLFDLKLDGHELTGAGFLKVPGFATRTGIFKYLRADGSVINELRPETEVYKPETLNSLLGLPVTDLHPEQMVTKDNFQELQKGFTDSSLFFKDDLIGVMLTIQDQDLINDVLTGKKDQLSCGYLCKVVAESGDHSEGKFDSKQTNIIYNHLAIVPRGRAGNRAKIVLDNNNNINQGENLKMKKFKIDSDEFEVSEVGAVLVQKKIDELNNSIKTLTTENVKIQDQNKTIEAEKDILKADLDKANKVDVEKLVNSRLDLISKAKKVLPENYDFTGKTDQQIKKDAVLSVYKDDSDINSKADDNNYIDVVFSLLEKKAIKADVNGQVMDQVNNTTGPVDQADQARADMQARFKKSFNDYKGS